MLAGWKKDSQNTYTADELLEKYINLYNACIAKVPEDMHVGVHLCRGNFVNSRHFSEGGYDRIATMLFQKLNMNTYVSILCLIRHPFKPQLLIMIVTVSRIRHTTSGRFRTVAIPAT